MGQEGEWPSLCVQVDGQWTSTTGQVASSLEVTASVDDLVMAVEHVKDAALGFQFHPESVLTTYGSNLLAQAIEHVLAMSNQAMPKTSNSPSEKPQTLSNLSQQGAE